MEMDAEIDMENEPIPNAQQDLGLDEDEDENPINKNAARIRDEIANNLA